MAENDSPLTHVAIILDGNGRWAKEHNLERVEGHLAGAKNVVNFVKWMQKYPEIKFVTLYAFSTENWKRSKEEVDALMSILCDFLDSNLALLKQEKIRLRMMGDINGLPAPCQVRLQKVMEETSSDFRRTFILALNYGSRQEITFAARKIAAQVQNGTLSPDDITEQTIASNLFLPDVPNPDLMIRTSGEQRISNFLLWQLSYSEFYFTPVYWPDFDISEFDKAVQTFYHRNRRFGGR